MIIKRVSLNSVIVYFKQDISETVLNQVQALNTLLQKLKGIVDIVPSYCSVLVTYDRGIYNYKSIKEVLNSFDMGRFDFIEQELHNATECSIKSNLQVIKIPTDYSKNLDLERVANHNNLTIEEVITLHTQQVYRVYAIGFMVGFAYLAQVDPKIATPRLTTPRAKIPKGSVAIADTQTAIYPQDSAGGWNIIGSTEFNAFEQFSIGDYVQFTKV